MKGMQTIVIEQVLKNLGLTYVKELKFSEKRKFRFDFALPFYKIAIEYDGIVSSKSRHTSITGFSRDCEKTNLAIVEGWKVLRYTALNYGNLEQDLKQLLS